LIESELFGHVRGAFTGAERDRVGLFETAAGGTVLLDEVGDLPATVQVKLLRFLDSYELRRVGEHRARTADVRVLAATNRDLEDLVRDGRFREDLLFRLNVFRIDVPPLRQRREDIPGLAERFLTEESHTALAIHLSHDLLRWFEAYDWPGNVRQLRNLCRYLSARCWGRPEIGVRDLPSDLQEQCVSFLTGTKLTAFERDQRDFERTQLQRALQQTGGNISETARLLRTGRNQIAARMRLFNLTRDEFRPRPKAST
jgi:DNA-binding NtrC family response regulator